MLYPIELRMHRVDQFINRHSLGQALIAELTRLTEYSPTRIGLALPRRTWVKSASKPCCMCQDCFSTARLADGRRLQATIATDAGLVRACSLFACARRMLPAHRR